MGRKSINILSSALFPLFPTFSFERSALYPLSALTFEPRTTEPMNGYLRYTTFLQPLYPLLGLLLGQNRYNI